MTDHPHSSSNGATRDLLFDTKAVAGYLKVNEKMVYSLVSEKGLPATKVTGKWLFPKQLVDQWLETHTRNYPQSNNQLPPYHGLLIITGSNDPLLDKTLALFNRNQSGQVAVFGNLGSMGGLQALSRGSAILLPATCFRRTKPSTISNSP